MKLAAKLTAILSAVAILTFSGTVYAENAGGYALDYNVLDGYYSLDWDGDDLYYDANSGAIFFKHGENAVKTASWTVELPADKPLGMWFYIDVGNGSSADVGDCSVSVVGKDGEALATVSAAGITGELNYHRYYAGEEKTYLALPDGAEKVVVTLTAEDKDGGELVDVYFRNAGLFFSNTVTVRSISADQPFMTVSGNLTLVEIGKMDFSYWIWLAIIIVVAFIFYFIRMRRQKYKTASVMKPGKTK